MLGQLDDNGTAFIFWDGYDCVYQHGRRNSYGDVPPNDWVFWEKEQGRPLLAFDAVSKTWTPRKQFYEHAQIMKFAGKGSIRLGVTGQDSTLSVHAYRNPDGKIVILGQNNRNRTVVINAILANLSGMKNLKLYYTNSTNNLSKGNITNSGNSYKASIPALSVFTITVSK
jgi:O-glycosyl hydrolase